MILNQAAIAFAEMWSGCLAGAATWDQSDRFDYELFNPVFRL
jgi:hypothetical protein